MYTAAKAMPTAGHGELIDKYKFARVVLNGASDTFLIHVKALKILSEITTYISQAA